MSCFSNRRRGGVGGHCNGNGRVCAWRGQTGGLAGVLDTHHEENEAVKKPFKNHSPRYKIGVLAIHPQ